MLVSAETNDSKPQGVETNKHQAHLLELVFDFLHIALDRLRHGDEVLAVLLAASVWNGNALSVLM
jgi:hypothetical protein